MIGTNSRLSAARNANMETSSQFATILPDYFACHSSILDQAALALITSSLFESHNATEWKQSRLEKLLSNAEYRYQEADSAAETLMIVVVSG